jgi:hypothetical protein
MRAIHPFLSKRDASTKVFQRSLKCEPSAETFLKRGSITDKRSECREATMSAYAKFPEIYSLMHERERVHRQTEQIGDAFIGLTVLFGCVGTLVLGAGLWLHAPIFTLAAAFAFVAAVAFAFSSRHMARLGRIVEPKPVAPSTRPFRDEFVPLRKAA